MTRDQQSPTPTLWQPFGFGVALGNDAPMEPFAEHCWVFVASILALGACGPPPEPAPSVVEDQGRVCVQKFWGTGLAAGPHGASDEGRRQELHVNVMVAECLSSSCSRPFGAGCTVARGGRNLIVRSWGVTRPRRDVSCTADCGKLEADCYTGTLEPGGYVVTHGAQRLEITVPMEASLCAGP